MNEKEYNFIWDCFRIPHKLRPKYKGNRTMIQPLFDQVLLKPVDTKKDKIGALYIPDIAQDNKTSEYTVIAIGTGGKDITFDVLVGDIVVCNSFGGMTFKCDGVLHKLISHNDIVARIRKVK